MDEKRKKYYREYYKEYYKRNRERYRGYVKKWQNKNKDKIKKYREEYNVRPEIKKRYSENWKNWYAKNKKKKLEYCKEYRIKNKLKISIRNKELYLKQRAELDRKSLDEQLKIKKKLRIWTNKHYKNNKEKRREIRKTSYYNNFPKEKARSIGMKIPLKKTCETCGSKDRLQRHHEDYTKPLEVMTLCSLCHGKLHRKI